MSHHQQVRDAPLYTAAGSRELDRLAVTEFGLAGTTLMERAGAAAFARLREHWPGAGRVAVLCGTGNNGGDGFVLARLARGAGLRVRVFQLGDPQRIRGEARQALEAMLAAGVTPEPFQAGCLAEAQVLVDALFGTGLERPVADAWREAIETVNAHGGPVLALDIPSGLHADTGAVLGAAVNADLTVTFIARKRGLYTGQGPARCGAIRCEDLQVPAALYARRGPDARLLEGPPLGPLARPRPRTAHKGDHGHVLVVGGAAGMGGAARLAGEAAARAGAGLVSLATDPGHAATVGTARPELMVHGVDGAAALSPLLARATVLAVGPGLGRGPWAESLWEAAVGGEPPLVMDADALNLLARRPRRRADWVLTPHPGEAARLLGSDVATVEADRFAAAAALVGRYGGVVVLKGAGTLVAAAGADTAVCPTGNPGMASGGMGDVLTGVIAGLLAQGLPPGEAARCGVWIHGAAGDRAARAGERGLLAGDLVDELRGLLNP